MDLEILKDMPPWDWPEDAGTMFLEILGDAQAKESDRVLAAELAGDYTVINDEIAEALLAIVCRTEETAEMRSTAALSLGVALEHADTMGFEDDDDILLSEDVYHRIQQSLHQLFLDMEVPAEVRRQVLEVSARAPQAWHEEAVRSAYASNDEDWRLTAVFCMRFIRGFETQILEALNSDNLDMHYQAVCAAGNWGVDAAWLHIAALVTAPQTDKDLRLAAIDAVASIRPHAAIEVLADLMNSDDEDIADAVFEALTLAEGLSEYDDEDEEEEDDDDDDRYS
jgi:hypothetical protein